LSQSLRRWAVIGPSGPRLPDPYLHLGLSLFSRRRADRGRRGQQWQLAIARLWVPPVSGCALGRYRSRGRAACGCCAKRYPRVVRATGRGVPRLGPWLVIELEVGERSEHKDHWVRWRGERRMEMETAQRMANYSAATAAEKPPSPRFRAAAGEAVANTD
jgi:hypothetical protein